VTGGWTTSDRLFPRQPQYRYVNGRPINHIDPTGYAGLGVFKEKCDVDPCENIRKVSEDPAGLIACMAAQGFDRPGDRERVLQALAYMQKVCKGDSSLTVPIFVLGTEPKPPKECAAEFEALCNNGAAAFAKYLVPNPDPVSPPGMEICSTPVKSDCSDALRKLGATCTIVVCHDGFDDYWKPKNCNNIIYHELTHCAGFGGAPKHNRGKGTSWDFVYSMGCCMCKVTTSRSNIDCWNCGKRLDWLGGGIL
jgi:hypothetical protein